MSTLLIHGGRIVDPSQDLDGAFDLLIEDGAVAKIGGKIKKPKDAETFDASGLVVAPESQASPFPHLSLDQLAEHVPWPGRCSLG